MSNLMGCDQRTKKTLLPFEERCPILHEETLQFKTVPERQEKEQQLMKLEYVSVKTPFPLMVQYGVPDPLTITLTIRDMRNFKQD